MYKIQFSVLSYYPSIVTNENINVGILFHNLSTNERKFHILKNWKRLEKFDDELDIDFIRQYLIGIKNECELNIFNHNEKFSLNDYVRFYINELRFCPVKEANVSEENVETFINDTEKVYMRYDFEKRERLSKESEVNYIKKIMKSNNINYSAKEIKGKYEDKIKFDYIVGDYGFKNFIFEGKNLNKMIMNAKAWAYNAESMKDKYKTIFVYDIEKNDSSNYHIINNILNEHAYDVMTSAKVLDFVISNHVEEIGNTL